MRTERDASRISMSLGQAVRRERRRRQITLRELSLMSCLAKSTIHDIESGEAGSIESYVLVARALGLRPEFDLVDPRRRETTRRQVDTVHAAMVEAQAAHLRALGHEVRLDEPYQHYQFAGRADVVSMQFAERALLHIEDKTELDNVQDLFGSFNAKRAYLGTELGTRFGIESWRSETHVIAALWSADVLRALRRHRASFESVCPDGATAFVAWWSGATPPEGRHSTLVLFDPRGGRPGGPGEWIGFAEADASRARYRDYQAAAEALRRPEAATITCRDRRAE